MSDRRADRRGLTALILTVGLVALSVVLIRTAWVSDDAFEPAGARRTWRLTLLASLCLLNRLDLALLVGPVLAIEIWHSDRRTAVPAVVAGLLPLVAWEMFSLVCYGFLLPNRRMPNSTRRGWSPARPNATASWPARACAGCTSRGSAAIS